MRVQYTLPGFLPAETPSGESTEAVGSPFRTRLTYLPAPRGPNWKNLLHVDEPPVNATSIGPPPRPPSLETTDAASERLNWRQMLDRQVASLESGSQSTAPGGHADSMAIGRMLGLLMTSREVEDSIATRYLSEPEG
jgi:hypothetical protein